MVGDNNVIDLNNFPLTVNHGSIDIHVLEAFLPNIEEVTTSLIPIDAILPEICTSIVGFSCTAWTKMRLL